MTDFDIDLDDASVRQNLQELKQQYETEPIWVVESGAEYSIYLEFGRGPVEAQQADALRFEDEDGNIIYRTRVEGHPPYPFFGPAIREFEANPESFLLDNTELGSLDEISSTEELVKNVAQSLEAQMKRNATANAPNRSPGTHPNHPQVQSGNLRARISARRVR
jgi:hypothetical protein